MRLTAVHSRLGVRSGCPSVCARRLGSQISSSTDGPHRPFSEQVESLSIQQFTTSIIESNFTKMSGTIQQSLSAIYYAAVETYAMRDIELHLEIPPARMTMTQDIASGIAANIEYGWAIDVVRDCIA